MGISSTGSPFYLTELFMNPLNLFSSLSGGFGIATRGVTGFLRVAAEPLTQGVSQFSSYLSGGHGSPVGPGSTTPFATEIGELKDLMSQQTALQFQMQKISLESNLIKSDHEMRMAVIRNTQAS
jgi:hypothetical protein